MSLSSRNASPFASTSSPLSARTKVSNSYSLAKTFALAAVVILTFFLVTSKSVENGLKDLDLSFSAKEAARHSASKGALPSSNPGHRNVSKQKSAHPKTHVIRPKGTAAPTDNEIALPSAGKSWLENIMDGVQQFVGGGDDSEDESKRSGTKSESTKEKKSKVLARPQTAADEFQREYIKHTMIRRAKGLANRTNPEDYERLSITESVNAPAAKYVPRSMEPFVNPPAENYPLSSTIDRLDVASKALLTEDPIFPFEVTRTAERYEIPDPVTVVEDEDGVEWELEEFLRNEGVAANSEEAELLLANKRVTLLYPSERIPPEDADRVATVGSIWHELKLNYRNAPLSKISNDRERSRCLILAMGSANCDYYFESLEQCIARHGSAAIGAVLGIKCVDSAPWRESLSKLTSWEVYEAWMAGKSKQRSESSNNDKVEEIVADKESSTSKNASRIPTPNPKYFMPSSHGYRNILKPSRVHAAEVCDATFEKNASAVREKGKPLTLKVSNPNPRPKFVEPSKRFVPPYGEPRICRTGAYQYPVAFGTPSRNIQRHPFPKLFDFTPVPVSSHMHQRVVGYNDEDFNQALGQLSYYCLTHARGGWDCGRHHEILSAGCVPYFLDVHAMPPHILSHFPTSIFRDVVSQPAMKKVGHITGAKGDNFGPLTNNADGLFSMGHSHHGRSQVMFPYDYDNVVSFDHDLHNETHYWSIARRMLKFSQKFATSEAMVSYILNTMGIAETTKSILFLSRGTWDNMGLTFLTGANGLGIEITYVTGENNPQAFHCIQPDAPEGKTKEDIQTRFGTLTTKSLEGIRNQMNRIGLHGGGLPWANRIRGGPEMLKFVPNIESLPMMSYDIPQSIENSSQVENSNEKNPKDVPPEPQAQNKDLAARLRPFDAIVFGFTRQKHEWMREYASIKPGHVAVLDFQDSVEDPEGGADEVARHVFYFSRELRRLQC